MDPDELDTGPAAAASALAQAALQAVEWALLEFRTSPLGRTEEAETEARRSYRIGQNNRCQ
ncbi:hypothetical protein GCM10010232_71010 [Streptomyces amakusaensis]|uniref:Uncharacterized protein n=1 Tax=Streptomyces amakusaensis TaxID=67271 RepID=A0ABW0AV46_9ACTN